MEIEKNEIKKNIFINKCINKFGNKYDYSKIKYINSLIKIEIKCNLHNNYFFQTPSEHLRGKNGCDNCLNRIKNTDDFISKSNDVYNGIYDYSESVYIDSVSKIKIRCKEHGIFNKLATAHVYGKQGCPLCYKKNVNKDKTLTNDIFIRKSKLVHGNKYDYSLVKYCNSKTKVKIICKEHGIFEQLPYSHIRGKGCVKCGINETKKELTKSVDDFIEECNDKHNYKYDYSLVNYIGSHNKVKIICPKHGEFEQLPYDHISGHGCEKCSSSISKLETEIDLFLKKLNLDTITSSMSIISPNQLDIYIPSKKLAIEFNGLYWHNELHVDKNYHLNKTELCEKLGIQLIHIFEDEWLYKEDIVKSRLRNILGLTENKIFGRKCIIKEITPKESKEFLNKNHIQGSVNSKIKLGLYYEGELVSLMSFNHIRNNSNDNSYDLVRFCNKLNTNIIGGADKLLKYFINNYKPKQIISYADRRWSQGNLYEKLGFNFIHYSKPNYFYIIGKNRKHKSNFKYKLLVKQGFDKNKKEHQIMIDRGIYRIYDCGVKKYELLF